jgi:hypothetical protein
VTNPRWHIDAFMVRLNEKNLKNLHLLIDPYMGQR